jgi:hypothetical protein
MDILSENFQVRETTPLSPYPRNPLIRSPLINIFRRSRHEKDGKRRRRREEGEDQRDEIGCEVFSKN